MVYIDIKSIEDLPSKTSFPNGIRKFDSLDGIWGVLQTCELIKKYDLECIVDTIVEYMPIKEVRFGDIIRIQRHNAWDHTLFVDGISRFQIVKYDGSINRREVVHYGQNFLLKVCNDGDKNKYVQRSRIKHNTKDMEIHKTVRYDVGLMELTENIKYKQTTQFDNADEEIMGKVVRYDGNKIGITFGGNYVIKNEDDHKNACNDWRTWMTVRDHKGECVVSWFLRDEHLVLIQDL